jgi:hypothetical protein
MRIPLLLRPGRRTLRWLCIGAPLLVAVWLLGSLLLVYKLTHRPHAPFAEPIPAITWGKFEEHQIRTSDGQTLGAVATWLSREP